MLKRITKEIKNSNELIDVEFDDITRKLSFVHSKNYDYISFHIPLNYPFYPPKNFKINYKNVVYHKMGNSAMIYKYFKIDCICCYTVLCADNWNPSITIIKVLKEYELLKTIINASVLFYYIEKKNILNNDVLKVISSFIK